MLNKILPIIKDPIFVGVISAAVGAAVGSYLTKRQLDQKLEAKYAAVALEEVQAARTYYKKLNKAEEYSDPIKARAAMEAERLANPQRVVSVPASRMQETDPEKAVRANLESIEVERAREEYLQLVSDNVYTNADVSAFEGDRDGDDGLDRSNRSTDLPYIISHYEWEDVDPAYTRDNLTYYEGDDVLATMDDDVVQDPVGLVGIGNLKFGLASGDSDTVFIINHKHKTVMEVTRDEHTYAEVVLGHHPGTETPHIRHERDHRKVPRIRVRDDD